MNNIVIEPKTIEIKYASYSFLSKLTIAVDVDDVVLDLVTKTLKIYNLDFDDCLTINDITDWYIANFVKSQCGEKFYNYFKDRTVYGDMPEITGAIDGIKTLRNMGHRVIFVTHSFPEVSGEKYKRLKEVGAIDSQDDYIEAKDKSLIRADILIDDKVENVINFSVSNRQVNQIYPKSAIFTRPWNKGFHWNLRFDTWYDIINHFLKLQNSEVEEWQLF